jgi:hypothetical protein
MYTFLLSVATLNCCTINIFPLFLKVPAIEPWHLACTKEVEIPQKLYKTGGLLEFKHSAVSELPPKKTWLAPSPGAICSARTYTTQCLSTRLKEWLSHREDCSSAKVLILWTLTLTFLTYEFVSYLNDGKPTAISRRNRLFHKVIQRSLRFSLIIYYRTNFKKVYFAQ